MQPPFPSPTATWHNDTYDAISPTNASIRQTGKTVIITGAGSGIGRATAIAFATAGAARLVLIGRTESTLQETAKLIPAGSKVDIFPVSVTDDAKLRDISEQVGEWDILVLNAAHAITPSPIANASIQDWWQNYETNVRSVVVAAQVFIPRAKDGACFYSITAGGLALPPAFARGLSGYFTSKVAQNKIIEFLAVENPGIFFCAVHPGVVETKIFRDAGLDKQNMPVDSANLPAHFLVWLSQPKTKFLNGKMVWVNWDVEELEARAGDIQNSAMLTIGLEGWPFSTDFST